MGRFVLRCTRRRVATSAVTVAALLCVPLSAPSAEVALALRTPARHLVVLQHGLSGTTSDLQLLASELDSRGGGTVLAHAAAANFGRNLDGVAAGGLRLAEEIRMVKAQHPELVDISLVGNSLGGLYTRFAASELLDEETGLVAGLQPRAFVTIGCPHLGVRCFTFLPLPSALQELARFLFGRTGEELMLRDGGPLVMRMADPSSRFITALRSFQRRALYANLWGDFMVPFGTAALEPSWGAGVFDESAAKAFLERPGAQVLNSVAFQRRGNGLAAVRRVGPFSGVAVRGKTENEEAMAASLEACGWSKFAVTFRSTGTWFPMAHNKIAALRREGWRRWAFSWLEGTGDGDELMGHVADSVLGKCD